jgi:hypothetical protein
MTRRISERALQRFEGIHAAERAFDVAKQMGVRELDDSDSTHSFELYKHAGNGRVMHVTGRFTAGLRGEPGRNLPAEKCEAESVYSDFPKV